MKKIMIREGILTRASIMINNQRGFSLIELGFVLIATAFMVAGALQVYTAYRANQLQNEMVERMKDARAGMNDYLDNDPEDDALPLAQQDSPWQRYPCPADMALAPSDPGFGEELRLSSSTCGPLAPGSLVEINVGPDVVYIGAVPLTDDEGRKILGREQAVDSYLNTMTYAVSGPMVQTDARTSGGAGVITITDDTGNPVTDRAEYIIISHGPNATATCPAPGANQGDRENCDYDDAVFSDNIRSEVTGVGSFDDWVVYTLSPEQDKEWWSGTEQGRFVQNRNPGNVGVATTNPLEKLDVGAPDPATGNALMVTGGNVHMQSALMFVSQGRAFATQGEVQVGFANRACVDKDPDDATWDPLTEALPGTIRYNPDTDGPYGGGYDPDTYPGHEYCMVDGGTTCWVPVTHDDYSGAPTESALPCPECGVINVEERVLCPAGISKEFEISRSCQPYCVEESETAPAPCPPGYASNTGTEIIMFRSKTCPGGGSGTCPPIGTWGAWQEIQNDCREACAVGNTETRTASCPNGEVGTAIEERTVIACTDPVTPEWGPWTVSDTSGCSPAGCSDTTFDWSGGTGLNCTDSTGAGNDGDVVTLTDTDGTADYECVNGTWTQNSAVCQVSTGDPVCASWNPLQSGRQCGGGTVLLSDVGGISGSASESESSCMAACDAVEGATCCHYYEMYMSICSPGFMVPGIGGVEGGCSGDLTIRACVASTATSLTSEANTTAKLCADMGGGGASCSGPESGCAGQQVFWSGGCDGFTSDSCHGDSLTVSPADSSYSGSATFECNDGTWFQVGSGTCTPPAGSAACGTAAGTDRTSMPSGIAACSSGTQENTATPPYLYTWDCNDGGDIQPCQANRVVDGQCGGAQAGDPPTANAPSYDNICAFHDSVTSSPSNPAPNPVDVAGRWRWTCHGSYTGFNDRCFKTLASPPADVNSCNLDSGDNGFECTGSTLFTTYYSDSSFAGTCNEDCQKVNGVSCCELNDNGTWHVCTGTNGAATNTGDTSSWADSCSSLSGPCGTALCGLAHGQMISVEPSGSSLCVASATADPDPADFNTSTWQWEWECSDGVTTSCCSAFVGSFTFPTCDPPCGTGCSCVAGACDCSWELN